MSEQLHGCFHGCQVVYSGYLCSTNSGTLHTDMPSSVNEYFLMSFFLLLCQLYKNFLQFFDKKSEGRVFFKGYTYRVSFGGKGS